MASVMLRKPDAMRPLRTTTRRLTSSKTITIPDATAAGAFLSPAGDVCYNLVVSAFASLIHPHHPHRRHHQLPGAFLHPADRG